jgi:hypothetical protein
MNLAAILLMVTSLTVNDTDTTLLKELPDSIFIHDDEAFDLDTVDDTEYCASSVLITREDLDFGWIEIQDNKNRRSIADTIRD